MVVALREIIEAKTKRRVTGNIAHEFQDYGMRLAGELRDLSHKSLYIKLAKEHPRNLLEKAKEYALGYAKARSKSKIFMWFLKNRPTRNDGK